MNKGFLSIIDFMRKMRQSIPVKAIFEFYESDSGDIVIKITARKGVNKLYFEHTVSIEKAMEQCGYEDFIINEISSAFLYEYKNFDPDGQQID